MALEAIGLVRVKKFEHTGVLTLSHKCVRHSGSHTSIVPVHLFKQVARDVKFLLSQTALASENG